MKKITRKISSYAKKNKTKRLNIIMIALTIVMFGGFFGWKGYLIFQQEKHNYIVRDNFKAMALPGASINPQMVCMVNNMFMGIDQIPVVVKGKTYYGCCDKCVFDLNTDETVRYAIDPFSNKKVDKADAFMTMNPEKKGAILYFESEDNAKKYLENDLHHSHK